MTNIPHEGERVETGAIQFGNDWPGVFIRGDNAAAYAMDLRRMLEHIPDECIFTRASIGGLINTLESCRL
jgi:hypothetical protein